MDPQEIGRRLRELRKGRPMQEVATANGISVSALSMYEGGQRIPRDEVKIRLAKYYRTKIEKLFFE